ncbi:hypothetical protein SBADM41S_03806 [Streptomyces badius]
MLGIGELTLVLLVIVVVLSIKRLPDLVRSAGKAARILEGESGPSRSRTPRGPLPRAPARAPRTTTPGRLPG